MKSTFLQYSLFVLFIATVVLVSVWSWVLIDPNFTLVTHADWTSFRALVISLGYFQRQLSASIYVSLILLLTAGSFLITKYYKGSVLPLLIVVGCIAGLLSYPALSHDLFNYIFDARILTHYHMNPYLHKALDFPADPMLRFMHWVHRTYPYGPTYLLASLVPSALGLGIFALTFLMFKAMHVVLFLIAGWMLSKLNRYAALIFITSPLVIVEGLINTHNDFVALSIAIIGIYLLHQKKNVSASFMFLFSGLIKYLSLPVLFLSAGETLQKTAKKTRSPIRKLADIPPWYFVALGIVGLLVYLVVHQEIQPWYFLNLFILLPFAPKLLEKCTLFFTGLLLSYYPYVLGGEWGQGGDVMVKRIIIFWALLLNITVLLVAGIYRKLVTRSTFL